MELTDSEKHDLKIVLAALFGCHNVDSWRIDIKTLELLTEMISASKECSKLIDLVPRPVGWVPGVAYVRRQLRNLARRAVSNSGLYQICINSSAFRFRRRFDLLGQGL